MHTRSRINHSMSKAMLENPVENTGPFFGRSASGTITTDSNKKRRSKRQQAPVPRALCEQCLKSAARLMAHGMLHRGTSA